MVGFSTSGPNEAMVVVGCCYNVPRIVSGGRVFVWPFLQQLQRLSLNTMTLVIESPHVYTALGVAISVTGIAQVKVEGKNDDMLQAACQQFLGKSENEIEAIARETLEGHQRAIMGNMTVEEIYQDRKKFSSSVFEVASSDLVNMGMTIVSYTLKDIRDDQEIYQDRQKFSRSVFDVASADLVNMGLSIVSYTLKDVQDSEEIYQDRQKFSRAVFDVASADLVNMGLSIVSYTLKDVNDSEGYLRSLGQSRTAQVQRDARIGEAEAKKDAGIKQAEAEQKRMASKYQNDIQIAQARRDFEVKKAIYDEEVNTRNAQSELAYDLQAAKTKQKIKEEQMQVRVVERSQQIAVQEQEITRRERELEATVMKPAEAERYKMEKLCEAEKNRIILEAQAEAEAVRMKGEAQAFAIEAEAKADAEQMAKKADAWKDFGEAAMVDMVLAAMPKIAAEVAAPLAQTRKITMVSAGANSDVGAAKLTGEILQIMERLPDTFGKMTGMDITKVMQEAQSGRTA